jgi:hypothetical protein
MHTVATKVDNGTLDPVNNKCSSLGCTPAEYVKNLIKKDLELGCEATNNHEDNTTSQSPIPHKSHPDIKLVRSIEQDGRTYYFDTEGNKYSMKQGGKLIPVITGRIVRIF